MPFCPKCGARCKCVPYDFGICPDTGYHDTGEVWECTCCDWVGDDPIPEPQEELLEAA